MDIPLPKDSKTYAEKAFREKELRRKRLENMRLKEKFEALGRLREMGSSLPKLVD